jgi:hypothetical protein
MSSKPIPHSSIYPREYIKIPQFRPLPSHEAREQYAPPMDLHCVPAPDCSSRFGRWSHTRDADRFLHRPPGARLMRSRTTGSWSSPPGTSVGFHYTAQSSGDPRATAASPLPRPGSWSLPTGTSMMFRYTARSSGDLRLAGIHSATQAWRCSPFASDRPFAGARQALYQYIKPWVRTDTSGDRASSPGP